MKQDCIFCKIAAGTIPCAKIYEDEELLAFLDINPVNKGHVLIIPKAHYQMMADTPEELVSIIFIKAKSLMKIIKEVLSADYVAVSVVGLDVPHFHVHLVPRFKDDGLANWWPTKKYEGGEIEDYANKIKNALSI